MRVHIKLAHADVPSPPPSPKLDTKTDVLQEIILHPHKLLRLPHTEIDDDKHVIRSTVLGYNFTVVPYYLPIDYVLVRYSDGLIRVLASLYQLVFERNVVEEKGGGLQKIRGDDGKEWSKKRFNDDNFNVLGGSASNDGKKKYKDDRGGKGNTNWEAGRVVQRPTGRRITRRTKNRKGSGSSLLSSSPSRVSASSSDNRNQSFTNEDSHHFDLVCKNNEVEIKMKVEKEGEDKGVGVGDDGDVDDASTIPPCTQ